MSFPRYPKYKHSGVEWLGEVPEHWEVRRLGSLFRQIDEPGDDGLPILSVSIHDGVSDKELDEKEMDRKVSRSEDKGKYKKVAPGDLVYNMMRAWQGGFGCVSIAGMVSPAYVVARPTADFDSAFIEQLLRTPQAVEQMRRHSQGVTDFRLRLYWEEFKTLEGLIPPRVEQRAIAAFLDRETAKIDELVGEQRRLIELLKEKRQAVISHAVTKGLNPHAKLKPSGIEWLGDVPDRWRVLSLGRVTLDCCDGPFGSGLKSEHYTETGVRVVRLQNIRACRFDDGDEAFINVNYYEDELSDHDVVGGDVLIAGLGDDNNSVGRACVAPDGIEPAMVKADCFRFRLDKDQADPAFVAIQLSAGASYDAGVLSSGSTRARIPLSVTRTRRIALPKPDEQRKIAEYIQSQTREFDTLTAEAERAIELLQERRTALISAAVTGKIDVRGLEHGQAAVEM